MAWTEDIAWSMKRFGRDLAFRADTFWSDSMWLFESVCNAVYRGVGAAGDAAERWWEERSSTSTSHSFSGARTAIYAAAACVVFGCGVIAGRLTAPSAAAPDPVAETAAANAEAALKLTMPQAPVTAKGRSR